MKNAFKTVLLFLAIFLSADRVKAQEEFSYRNMISYITMKNGLHSNFIDFIHKDSRGFLWLATNGGGLSRYDGYEFVHFNLNDSKEKLKSNFINGCCEDAFGRLWITSREGIDILDLSTNKIVTLQDTQGETPIFFQQSASNATKDSQGNMWVYCDFIVYKITFDENGNILKSYSLSPTLTDVPVVVINDIDGDGDVWVAIGHKIHKVFTGENSLEAIPVSSQLEFPNGSTIHALCMKENEVWIGLGVGLVRYNRSEDIIKWYLYDGSSRALTQSFITDIAVNSEQQLLISTLRGLNIYNPVTDDFEQIMVKTDEYNQGLSSNFINCIMVDGDITWIGTETGGLNKIVPKSLPVRSYVHDDRKPNSLLPNPVNAIFEDENENLWIGTVEGGLSLKKKGKDDFINYTQDKGGLSHNTVSVIAKDNSNQLWTGSWGWGISVLDLSTPDITVKKHILPTPDIHLQFIGSLHYDFKNDLMWIGADKGIYYYDIKTNRLYSPFEDEKAASQIRLCLGSIIDTSGRLWMGWSSGVYIFDLNSRKNNKFPYTYLEYKLDDPASRQSERITSFLLDEDSVLWIGSNGNGLYKHIPKEDGGIGHFENYNSQHGLISNTVRGILQDERKRLWISTENGLSCFTPSTGEFLNFKSDDGLMEDQFYWNAYLRSKNGLLYFGGIKGLTIIDPRQYGVRKREAQVVLTKLTVINEEVYPGQSYIDSDISIAKLINLHESDKSFSLEFSALNYDSPTTARYSYRLKGFDNHWTDVPDTRRFANYTNLPAGEYLFQVRYSVNGKTENSPITQIKIIVKPHFYKTTWFILLVVASIICLVVYRFYTLQKQKKDLHKAVTERTRELFEQNELLVQQNEEITKQKTQIMEMSEKVKEVTKDKLSFFTNITHEFRTPVTLIIGPIERALKLSHNPLVIEQLNFVERNSRYLLSLVNQLMDFRKIESRNMTITKTKSDFEKFISIIILPFKALADSRKIKLNQYVRLDTPEFMFDQDAMQKVITNLLANAMKFTPEGGCISLYVANITDSINNRQKLYISIRDTGTGIPEEDLDKIFNHFYQSKTEVKYPVYGQSGTGIGLYLCKHIINQLEGTIYAVNNKKAGASFRILLPLSYEVTECGENNFEESPEDKNKPLYSSFIAGKLTILIVEDNEDMRSFIRSLLTGRYNIIEAGNGKEALGILVQNHVDFIISDLMMPIMDGAEFSRKVRENFSFSHIPILILTAKTSQESRTESYKIGVDSYLSKPFTEELLIARINNIFEIRKRYQEQFARNMDIAELNIEEESKDEKFLNKSLKIICENYKNPSFSAADFAKVIGINKNLLNKKLHTLTGQTTTQFIRNYRLNIAREMIEKNRTTGNKNISEIAYEVGFNDPKYFTRCFTDRFNIPPKNLMDKEKL